MEAYQLARKSSVIVRVVLFFCAIELEELGETDCERTIVR